MTLLGAAQAAILLLALAGMAGLLCRLDVLKFGRHKLPVLGLHVGLEIACAWAALAAMQGEAGMGDLGAAIGALCWLWMSIETWADGVPEHHESGPIPLGDFDPHRQGL